MAEAEYPTLNGLSITIQNNQLYGRIVKIFGGVHVRILGCDGEIYGSVVSKIATKDDYVLIQRRSHDPLKVDILYVFNAEESLIVCKYMEDIEILVQIDEDENIKFSENTTPRFCSSHHHFLYMIEDIEEDQVYCDDCEEIIEEGGISWTCTVPYCHFDQCSNCALSCNTITLFVDDYDSPVFTLNTHVIRIADQKGTSDAILGDIDRSRFKISRIDRVADNWKYILCDENSITDTLQSEISVSENEIIVHNTTDH